MVASMTSRLPSVVMRMRTPLLNGSNGGAYGYGSAISPLNLKRSSPGAVLRRVTVIAGFVANTGMMLLHGSQASPLPSLSASCCPGLETFGQLSALLQMPSPSVSWTPVSVGHAALVPLHVSAGSQLLVDARQTNPLGRTVSPGQLTPEPSQFSATSQPPATGRHTVLDGERASAGQLLEEPSQLSAGSQAPAEARHWVPLAVNPFAGHVLLVPVQVSSTSQSPAAGRQTVPLLPAGCWQASLEPSHSSRVQGLLSLVQAVPAGLFPSAGQFGAFPGH